MEGGMTTIGNNHLKNTFHPSMEIFGQNKQKSKTCDRQICMQMSVYKQN